jgi:3-hydroxyacyl-CoA dehydrogenase
MTNVASVSIENGLAVLTFDSPPVNALGIAVRRALDVHFRNLLANTSVRGIVLACAGKTFFAGADIAEFGRPIEAPTLRENLELIESARKPVLAALHGTALGGGLELSLVCHYRLATPSAQLGLPEVNLGLLPGAGGTQRLPRLVGAGKALDIMVSGRKVTASEALELGILDGLVSEGSLVADAVKFLREVIATGQLPVPVRDRTEKLAEPGQQTAIEEFRETHARQFRGFEAPASIVKAVEAAISLPFEEGMKRELELFKALESSAASQAQRHVFFAERQTSKVPGLASSLAELPIASVGVVGAGTMGGGIAMNFLNVGIPVTIVETRQEVLDRGLAVIRRNYENTVKKGRLTAAQLEKRMSLLRPTLELKDLAPADLIVEAVFEEMEIKRTVFGQLDRIAKPSAILASNTSFLDVNAIAAVTSRPASVLGLHFFSPANVMRLLEVIRADETAPQILATCMRLARTIGKVPVLSGVCHGFIANRIMEQRSKQASLLLLEGVAPAEVDMILTEFGFAMGEFQMMDLVGLDVIGRGVSERTVGGDLVKLGRLGQKQNGGYYDYDESRKPRPSALVTKVIREVARSKQIAESPPIGREEILARLLYPVVNEGAKILQEGIASRASDIDMAAILGYNWPVFTGGPMYWADSVGMEKIVAQLENMQRSYGRDYEPASLLRKLASEGGAFSG